MLFCCRTTELRPRAFRRNTVTRTGPCIARIVLAMALPTAAFVGTLSLAPRLEDFLAENLTTAASVSALEEADLQNINGSPLDAQQLVRASVCPACTQRLVVAPVHAAAACYAARAQLVPVGSRR